MPPIIRYLVLALAVALHLVVLYAPSTPPAGPPAWPGVDKVGHAAVFGLVVLAGLWAGVPAAVVLPVMLAHAVVSELVQHVVLPERSGDPWDVVADGVGMILTWGLWRWWCRRLTSRARSAAPPPSGLGR